MWFSHSIYVAYGCDALFEACAGNFSSYPTNTKYLENASNLPY